MGATTCGGSLLYLGGNGIYEQGTYESDQTGMVFLGGNPDGKRGDALFRRLVPPRPERALLGVATERCKVRGSPYRVCRADHPIFRGTGLSNKETFGDYGLNTGWVPFLNGKASGWEVDTSDGPGATHYPVDCSSDAGTDVPPSALPAPFPPDPRAGLQQLIYG